MRVTLTILPSWPRETPSLAIAYLSSHLLKAGHKVSRLEFNLRIKNPSWSQYILDLNSEKETLDKITKNLELLEEYPKLKRYIDYCIKELLQTKPEIVGFSVYSPNRFLTVLIAKKLKEIKKDITIIFGGPTIPIEEEEFKEYLQEKIVNFLILEEGELTLPKLLTKIQKKEEPSIPDVMYLSNNKIKYLEKKGFNNLESLEFPTFRKQDIEYSKDPKTIPLITSRGCTYQCDFCQETKIWKCFRQRKLENVIEEIKFQIKNLNVNRFEFTDSLINANNEFLKKFCKLIIKEGIKITWHANIRVNKETTFEIFQLMYQSGCRRLNFGIESASEKVLLEMNKQITPQIAEQNLKDAHNNKILILAHILVGHPKETKEELNKTINFLKKNKEYIDSISVNIIAIPEKSDLHKKIQYPDYKPKTAAEKKEMLNILQRDLEKYYHSSSKISGLLLQKNKII